MRPINIANQRFGRLVAIRRAFGDLASNARREAVWKCKCDCGRTAFVSAHQLRKIKHGTRSCGCLLEEQRAKYLHPKPKNRLIGEKRLTNSERMKRWRAKRNIDTHTPAPISSSGVKHERNAL